MSYSKQLIQRQQLCDLRVGRKVEHLQWTARLYFQGPEHKYSIDGISELSDDATSAALQEGWKYLATTELIGVDAISLGRAEAENRFYFVEWPAIAGLDRLLEDGQLPDLGTMPISLAIVVIKSAFIVEDEERRRRLERWAINRLNLDPSAGASELLEYWGSSLDAGATRLNAIWRLSESEALGGAIALAIDGLLATRPNVAVEALHSSLQCATKHLSRARLEAIAESALANPAVVNEQRGLWGFVALALDPSKQAERFVASYSRAEIVDLFDGASNAGLMEAISHPDKGTREYQELIVRQLGHACAPADEFQSGQVTRAARLSGTVRRAITVLAGDPEREAGKALARLLEERDLTAWHPSLRHAQAQQARLQRDQNFKHPTTEAIRKAIAGGSPVNAADLRAIVLEELDRLRAELRTNSTTPWKRYWNLDSNGRPTSPLIENQCRDHLLDRLRDRLAHYHIAAILPEARAGEETRADMLILTGAGRNVPLEAKRHFHPDIWIAASTQLRGYAADPQADGCGIYLVFWFGNEQEPTPARPDGKDGPNSSLELEAMLIGDLHSEMRPRTGIVVFDVSDPKALASRPPRKKRIKRGGDSSTSAASR
jgi:hypothetical protein